MCGKAVSLPKFKGHIQRRAHRWYAALDIPKDVRPKFNGKPRFVKSLKTESEREARMLAAPIVAGWKADIEAARGKNPELVAKLRNALGTDANDLNVERIARLRSQLEAAKSAEDREMILEAIEAVAEGIAPLTSEDDPEADDPEAIALAQRVYGLATGQATDDYVEDWLRTLDNETKTKDLKRLELSRFVSRFPTLSDVSRKEVQRFCERLIGEDGLSRATVQRAVSTWRGYWKYLQAREVVPDDLMPFSGLSLPKVSPKAAQAAKRLPFAPAEVVQLWKAAKAKKGYRGQELADLILLAAYTGARREELCSLPVSNVDLKRHFFSIEDAKTKAGWREVPIHPAALATFERLCEGNDGYLFAKLTENKYGDRSDAIGKRFTKLKTELGFGHQYVFHSIRHTVVTTLMNAGVPLPYIQDIVGHEKDFTTGTYGNVSLAVKAKAIKKLKYPGMPD